LGYGPTSSPKEKKEETKTDLLKQLPADFFKQFKKQINFILLEEMILVNWVLDILIPNQSLKK